MKRRSLSLILAVILIMVQFEPCIYVKADSRTVDAISENDESTEDVNDYIHGRVDAISEVPSGYEGHVWRLEEAGESG